MQERDKERKRRERKRVSPFPGPNPNPIPNSFPNHLANKLFQTTSPTVQSNIFYCHENEHSTMCEAMSVQHIHVKLHIIV